jgi:hypothetical protein
MQEKNGPPTYTVKPSDALDELLRSNNFTGITYGDGNPTIGEIYDQIAKL